MINAAARVPLLAIALVVVPGGIAVNGDVFGTVDGTAGTHTKGTKVTVCQEVDAGGAPVDNTCVSVEIRTCPLVVLNDSSAEVCLPVNID
jgi:hypothetical protein